MTKQKPIAPLDKLGRKNPRRPNQSNRMKSAESTHLKVLEPIPSEAYDNPVEWASSHLEKQIPQSAKELEWALKFGDARTRREIAIELLGMKGISKKGEGNTQVVPAIQLIMNGNLPWTQALPTATKTPELIEGEVTKVAEYKEEGEDNG